MLLQIINAGKTFLSALASVDDDDFQELQTKILPHQLISTGISVQGNAIDNIGAQCAYYMLKANRV
jgi:hypothetical protein